MRHPARLYIAFSAFLLFVSMTVGMMFWFATQTAGTQAGTVETIHESSQQDALTQKYIVTMNKFFSDYFAAIDKVAFLKSNKHVLFEIKVPEEYQEQHMQVVIFADKIIHGESIEFRYSDFGF